MKKILHVVFVVGILTGTLITADIARAEDAFWFVPLEQLKITEGALPGPTTQPNGLNWELAQQSQPYAVLDGDGEAFVRTPQSVATPRDLVDSVGQPATNSPGLCVRAPAGHAITGRLYMPNPDFRGETSVKFSIPADAAKPDARQAFYEMQLAHYQRLCDEHAAGGAWFRFRANQAREAQGQTANQNAGQQQHRAETGDLDDMYSLFTGGRAVSENLQLDRAIGATKDEPETEDIDQITGLSVAEIDWTPLIKDLHPAIDPLATILPADQHVIFFPSFDAFVKTIELADHKGTPILEMTEPRSEDAGTKERYQQQLGLELNGLSKLLGPTLVDAVVVTGSDPYLRVGSDLTMVFQSKNPDALLKLLQAKIALTSATSGAERKDSDTAGLHFASFRSSDRKICSYLAATDNAVIVTNSPGQLQRIGDVIAKKSPALAAAPEYVYFRSHYPRGQADESAFIILTDATIRRWCSPRWRIADARRTRAAAVMADVQARHADEIATGKVVPTTIEWEMPHESFGDLTITSAGVSSSIYGSLDFMTPINELPIKKVTKSEKESYSRWRSQYQSDWRWAFDPIAARLSDTDQHLSLDLTVTPLIVQTDYRQFVGLTQGAELSADSGDPHADLLHFAMSINPKSPIFGMGENLAAGMSPKIGLHPLAWVGKSIALYLDDDPFWDDLAKVKPDQSDDFMEKNYHRLPLAVQIESNSGLRLAAFITAVRAFVEQSAPQMVQWESVPYNGKAYVKISETADARQGDPEFANLAIYYAATPKALIVSMNKSVIEHALDRQIAATQPSGVQPSATQQSAAAPTTRPWLGSNVAVNAQKKILDLLQSNIDEGYIAMMRASSYANLPILNEWKHRYPDQDPLAVHQKLWGTKVICPAGGSYVWNEKDQTMESTIFGSPTSPKEVSKLDTLLAGFKAVEAGITFEQQGLRARAQLDK